MYHLLHGKEWVGVLLEIIDIYDDESQLHRELGLVRMQPGTAHEFFFSKMVSKKNKITDSMGMVSTNWLFSLSEKSQKIKNETKNKKR